MSLQAQRQIYQIVLEAQLAAIACIKPGEVVIKPHQIASKVIQQGLIDLGIFQCEYQYPNTRGQFYHSYEYKYQVHQLLPCLFHTDEPGSDKIDPEYWDIGIRIEDDVLVTDNGNSVLTKALVKEIDDIENLMK
jgi:Xaa-Pro aminopeptidase